MTIIDTLTGLDAWLERPYTEAAKHEGAFENFCEENGFDYDDPAASDAFEQWLEDLEESRGEEEAERRAEARRLGDY